jgi:signal peptidase II
MNENKEFNLITFLLLFIIVLIPDQVSKFFISLSNFSLNTEYFSLFSWEDDSFFLNLISGLPRIVTQVFSSIIIAYLSLLLLGVLYFFKNKNLFYIKCGVTILFLSFISNFIDMAYKSSITLIIHFKPLPLSGNIASVFKYLGVVLIIFGTITHWRELTGKDSRRKTFLINNNYQLKTSLFFALALVVQGMTFTLFSYFYFNNFTFNFNLGNSDDISLPYLFGILVILILFTLVSFFACIIYTQKTVGPLVAFERFIDDLLAGKDAQMYMRDGDHLQDLKRLSEKLKKGIKENTPPPLP